MNTPAGQQDQPPYVRPVWGVTTDETVFERGRCRTVDVERTRTSVRVKELQMVESVQELEGELALSESLTAPRGSECLFCFMYRMLTSHGCNCALRWPA